MLTNALSSLRLTVFLLIAVAVFSAVGTFVPGGKGPLDDWFHSPFFVGIMVLLSINVFFCMLRRGRQTWRRILGKGEFRWRAGAFFSILIHLGVLVVMGAGAYSSLTGYIGTANIYVGEKSDLFFDWRLQRKERLPFSLEVISPEPEYYPIRARIGVRGPGGTQYGLWETVEGKTFDVPELGLNVRTARIDLEGGTFTIEARIGDKEEKVKVPFAPGMANAARFGDLEVVLVAWKRDLKMVNSDIRVIEEGKTVAGGKISINHPIKHKGYRIYQRDLGMDRYGNPYSGYQVVREPGLAFVWSGCIVVLLGLAGYFAVFAVSDHHKP